MCRSLVENNNKMMVPDTQLQHIFKLILFALYAQFSFSVKNTRITMTNISLNPCNTSIICSFSIWNRYIVKSLCDWGKKDWKSCAKSCFRCKTTNSKRQLCTAIISRFRDCWKIPKQWRPTSTLNTQIQEKRVVVLPCKLD